MNGALYFFAMGMRASILSGLAEIEFMSGLFLQTARPASMASMFVVSRQSVTSVTSCTVLTTNSISSAPALRAGPRLRSIRSTPAFVSASAISRIGFGSLSLKA